MKKTIFAVVVLLVLGLGSTSCTKDVSRSVADTTWYGEGHESGEDHYLGGDYKETIRFSKATFTIEISYVERYRNQPNYEDTYTINGAYVYDAPNIILTTMAGYQYFGTVSGKVMSFRSAPGRFVTSFSLK